MSSRRVATWNGLASSAAEEAENAESQIAEVTEAQRCAEICCRLRPVGIAGAPVRAGRRPTAGAGIERKPDHKHAQPLSRACDPISSRSQPREARARPDVTDVSARLAQRSLDLCLSALRFLS